MPKSVFSSAYASLIEVLVAARKERGVSQVELARRLGRQQTFISLVERRVRRIDVIEFYAIAKALGADPVDLFGEVARRMPATVEI